MYPFVVSLCLFAWEKCIEGKKCKSNLLCYALVFQLTWFIVSFFPCEMAGAATGNVFSCLFFYCVLNVIWFGYCGWIGFDIGILFFKLRLFFFSFVVEIFYCTLHIIVTTQLMFFIKFASWLTFFVLNGAGLIRMNYGL